ncbi:MAG TPA: type II secretion system F family protein, partial [Gemmatimonadales bacterium]|nr:type II secretion system F family protein [Gemmatimonadales bacterium]
MPNATFAFTAVRPNGAVETGVVEAETREAAASLIGARGTFPITVTRRSAGLGGAHTRVGGQDLALGLRALATLLQSGIPLARALAILDDLAPPAWKSALPDLRHRVEQGQPLGVALEASSLTLPAHVIGILRAGEAGSGLAAAVEQAALLLETRAATRAALRSALAYPAMLAVAGGASVTLLVTVVLPRFATLLIDYGQSLPLSTRVVLGIGALVRVLALPTIALVAG